MHDARCMTYGLSPPRVLDPGMSKRVSALPPPRPRERLPHRPVRAGRSLLGLRSAATPERRDGISPFVWRSQGAHRFPASSRRRRPRAVESRRNRALRRSRIIGAAARLGHAGVARPGSAWSRRDLSAPGCGRADLRVVTVRQSAALVTLNSPDTLCALYAFARDRCDAGERANRSVEYAGVC